MSSLLVHLPRPPVEELINSIVLYGCQCEFNKIEVIIFVVNVYLEQISYTYLSAKHICSMLDECEALSVYLVYFIRAGMVKQRVQLSNRFLGSGGGIRHPKVSSRMVV